MVCVDDQARFAVALCGGHQGGANDLARQVAAWLGAEAVITTATDGPACPASTTSRVSRAEGDVAGGHPPVAGRGRRLVVPIRPSRSGAGPAAAGASAGLPGPPGGPAPGAGVVTVTDLARPPGAAGGAAAARLAGDRRRVEHAAPTPTALVAGRETPSPGGRRPRRRSVEVATLDRKADEPAIVALAARLGVQVRTFDAAALAGVVASAGCPIRATVVAAAVGTPSVAEAAALLAAGPGAALVAAKQIAAGRDATVAVTRRARPGRRPGRGGSGPGRRRRLRTPAATAAVRHAEVVSGYGPYVDLAADLLHPSQLVLRWPIGAETERCRDALQPGRGRRPGGAGVFRRRRGVRPGVAGLRAGAGCWRPARQRGPRGDGGPQRRRGSGRAARPRPRGHLAVRPAHALGGHRAPLARRRRR